MRKTYKYILDKIDEGKECALASIIEVRGSSPRKAGAMMAIDADGIIEGTIGGGQVEYEVIQYATQLISRKCSATEKYILQPSNDSKGLNMVCGGEMTVKIEYIAPNETNKRFYSVLLENHEQKRKRVFIFGGGHIAYELAQLLYNIDFSVSIFDNGSDILIEERFKNADGVIIGDFEKIGEYVEIGKEDYVLIMTRGHEYDYAILKQVLMTDALYIGMVGSSKKIAIVKERLQNDGFSDKEFDRVYTPVGLHIKAETPAEIAISIAAEMILVRANNN